LGATEVGAVRRRAKSGLPPALPSVAGRPNLLDCRRPVCVHWPGHEDRARRPRHHRGRVAGHPAMRLCCVGKIQRSSQGEGRVSGDLSEVQGRYRREVLKRRRELEFPFRGPPLACSLLGVRMMPLVVVVGQSPDGRTPSLSRRTNYDPNDNPCLIVGDRSPTTPW